jgi:hypothetical protein
MTGWQLALSLLGASMAGACFSLIMVAPFIHAARYAAESMREEVILATPQRVEEWDWPETPA